MIWLIRSFMYGFNEKAFWRHYWCAKSSRGLRSMYHTFWYVRIVSKCSGSIGKGIELASEITLPHGFNGIHIAADVKIGKNCTILQNVTIGRGSDGRSPEIGDSVFIGANAVVIGGIKISNGVVIGAGAIVCDDIPENCTVVGQKARIIKRNNMRS